MIISGICYSKGKLLNVASLLVFCYLSNSSSALSLLSCTTVWSAVVRCALPKLHSHLTFGSLNTMRLTTLHALKVLSLASFTGVARFELSFSRSPGTVCLAHTLQDSHVCVHSTYHGTRSIHCTEILNMYCVSATGKFQNMSQDSSPQEDNSGVLSYKLCLK